jgi:hypothetical protein
MEAEVGMLVVETIAKIRRAYFVDGRPIKAICRELGVSRKVVRKVIRSQATEFRYERETQPLPKMGPWSAELDRLLAANESKAMAASGLDASGPLTLCLRNEPARGGRGRHPVRPASACEKARPATLGAAAQGGSR